MLEQTEESGLSARWHRSAVIGLLLVVLAAVSVALPCDDEASACCCSSKQGGCPMPARQDASRPQCCEAAPTPTPTAAVVPAPMDSLQVAGTPLVAVAAPVIVSATVACSETRAHAPPGVSLHTLHAVFLI